MLTVLTGRSRRLWPRVVEEIGVALAAGEERLLLLVPGQFTLAAELELVDRLNLPGFFAVEVLSPARLMTRVFSLAGTPERVKIDSRGKAMMLADVLRLAQKDLVYYGGAALRRGFAERMAASIGELKRAGMPPEAVLALMEGLAPEDALRGKLADIALLYSRYEQRLEGAFLDGEDAQEALLMRLPASGLLDGARVWIYGFDLISPQFARQIALMARRAEAVRLALTLENETARDGLCFAPSRDTLARLARHMDAERLSWEREHIAAPLQAAPAIRHLERELFAMPQEAFDGDASPIVLRVAKDPYEEAALAAASMRALAQEGMRFEEMAMVVGDVEGYRGAVDTALAGGGIPYHIAVKRPALSHPLLRSWLAALRCVTRGFRAEDTLEWLKGGFSGLSIEEAEALENHAVEYGLRGAKWQRPAQDVEMDALRERFIAPLARLQGRLREAEDATESLAAVYGILEDVDAYATLEAWQEALTGRGLLVEAADCAQAWRLLLETLEQLHSLLRGSRLSMRALAQVVEAGLATAELGAIPQAPGAVQVGQLGHVKLMSGLRAVFLLGMQDGVLHAEEPSLLTDAEAARASAAGSDAAFGLRGDALAQLMQINLLDTLAAPSERLFISHALSGTGGEAQRPAAVLRLIKKVLPGLEETGGVTEKVDAWYAPGAALNALGPALREAAARGRLLEEERDAAAWLWNAPDTREKAERVIRAFSMQSLPQPLPKAVAQTLYAHTKTSVSRLESFAHCPYRHFIAYGLRPKPRRDFIVARNETGTFYHRAIEGYAKAAARDPAWPEVSRAQSDALMDGVLAPLRAEWEHTPLADNAMMRALGDSFCRVARRTAWAYAGQMRRGRFRTGMMEARFGAGEALPPVRLTLPDGQTRWVEGRIDRIDFYEDEGQRWLYVVDYKSGGASVDFSRVLGGLQLQLLIYLTAALQASPGVQAAGAFYARFDDPMVMTDSRDTEEIERLLAAKLRLKGIVLSDVRVVRAMDGGESMITQKGTMARRENILEGEDLDALMRHAYDLSGKIAARIAAGDIELTPAQLSGWNACRWCDYQSICRFDPGMEGHRYRRLEKLKKEEVMDRLKHEPGM